MEMVRQELDRDPNISLDDLFRKAKEIDAAVGDLSMRQFHARYPLPIKRSRSPRKKSTRAKGRRGAKRGSTGADTAAKAGRGGRNTPREEVRKIFLEFAGELARAESRASIVEALSNVDQYVDRVVRKAGRAATG